MKFPSINRIKRGLIALLAISALMTLVLLASGLAEVVFKPAQLFFTPDEPQQRLFEFSELVENAAKLSPGDALLLIGGFLILFGLVLMMLSPEARKQLIKTIFRIGLTAWAVYYALARFRPEGIVELESQNAAAEGAAQVVVAPPPYTPPAIPTLVIYIVSFVMVMVLVGFGFLVYRLLRPTRRPFQNLARAARSALNDLSNGRNWDDTVISCYIRMGAAVSERRGLVRQSAMTPDEFAKRLAYAGLPSEPVHRLTRLFEKARYSGHSTSQEDVNEAASSLSSILLAMGEKL